MGEGTIKTGGISASLGGSAKFPYEIDNPFLNAARCPRGKGREPLFYMYCYYGEDGKRYFAYHGADTPQWYIVKNGNPVKVDVRRIKLEYFDFKQISHFKDTGFKLKTDPKVKAFLADLSVNPDKHIGKHEEHIIVKDNLFSQEVINTNFTHIDKATLQFINYKDAEEFFKNLLYYICYDKGRHHLTAEYMKFYVDLLRRFDNKTLRLDINHIIPPKKLDDKRRWINYRDHEYASVFYQYVVKSYRFFAKEEWKYDEKIRVFPDIRNGKGFKTWAPGRQRGFFEFCKAHYTGKKFGDFTDNIRDESQFEWFSLKAEKSELKFGFGPHTAAYEALRNVNFINPADSLKKINANIVYHGPHLNESPEKINKFLADYDNGKYGRDLILYELKLPQPEGSRLVLLKNSPEVVIEIEKQAGVNKSVKDWQYYLSEKFYKKMDLGTTAIEKTDQFASPLVVNIANNIANDPRIADGLEKIGGAKFIYRFLRFLYVFYRVWAVVLNLEFLPISFPYFYCIISRIPADIANLIYNTAVAHDEQAMLDGMAVIFSLVTAKVATEKALQIQRVAQWCFFKRSLSADGINIMKRTKELVKAGSPYRLAMYKSGLDKTGLKIAEKTIKLMKPPKTPLRMTEEWFVKNFKKYLLNPKMYPELAKFGIDAGKLSAKSFMGLVNKTAAGLGKFTKLTAAKTALKTAKGRVKPPMKTTAKKVLVTTGKTVINDAETVTENVAIKNAEKTALNTAEEAAIKAAKKKALASAGTKLIVGAVAVGVAAKLANPLFTAYSFAADKSFPVGGDYYGCAPQDYQEKYNFEQFDKARMLFTALYNPKNDNDKSWTKFYADPDIYAYTEIANDKNIVKFEIINGITTPVVKVSENFLKTQIKKRIKELKFNRLKQDCRRCH